MYNTIQLVHWIFFYKSVVNLFKNLLCGNYSNLEIKTLRYDDVIDVMMLR